MTVTNLRKPARDEALPLELYASLVASLFGDARPLFFGSAAACCTCAIAAWRISSVSLLLCALALSAVGGGRALLMSRYRKASAAALPAAAIRDWEMKYVCGATAHVSLIGLFCVLSFALTLDPFVHLLSFSGLLAYVIGTAGRNFSNLLIVKLQIFSTALFMTLAMAIAGLVYWVITIFVLVPFFLSMWSIAKRLRGIYLDALVRAHDLEILAARFDTALNNMPHGLAMFDHDGKLLVSNLRLAELLRFDLRVDWRGCDVNALLLESARCGVIQHSEMAALKSAFQRRLAGELSDDLVIKVGLESTLSLKFKSMENGGSVVVAEDITDRQRAEIRINHLARYDVLTGLPNRVSFSERTDARLRDGGNHSILFVDLDHFKQVNDTLGHACGDKLLHEVARRLLLLIDSEDIAARFGGDEFVVFHTLTGNLRDASQLAEVVIEALSRPYRIAGHDIVVGATIGAALSPRDGDTIEQLLKNADMALYRAKTDGRGTVRLFEPAMDVQARARRDMELALRDAVTNGEFELFFQPIFNLKARAYSVCEALLRWRHPVHGMISPAQFVTIAEEMGLIVEIGRWVLGEACRQCATWPTDVRVAVNVSPLQFRRDNIVAAIEQALAAADLAPSRLEIEITETLLLQNLPATRLALDALRAMGVRISLDDFGTGYSSLSYLHTLPLHKVKIDRSFLDGLCASARARKLLHGVARLSAELGMQVVVEGVETEQEFALIAADSHVDEVQGYLFSRPVPWDQVAALLVAPVARVA